MKNKPNIITPAVIAFLLISWGPLGCSLFDKKDSPPSAEGNLSGTDEQIFVGDTIEMNYDPNVIMKRAESFHEKEGYPEAIVEYQHFLDLHRNHVLAPYAQYRLALSHFKMIQTIDRDMTPVKKAREEFLELMEVFPGSRYEAEARVKIKECEGLIAEHHLFVGQFYYRKEAYLAAAKRFKMVIDSYPHLEEAVEAKYQLAKAYKDLGATEWSRDWAIALVREHPQHDLRKDGLKLLATLQKENPDLVVAQNLGTINRNLLATSFFPVKASTPLLTSPSPQPGGNFSITGNSSAPAVQPQPSITDCSLGSWCETSATSQPAPSSVLPSSPPIITCSPGTWCE